MSESLMRAVVSIAALAVISGCASAPSASDRIASASARIVGSDGAEHGTAELWQDRDNIVHLEANLAGLPAGSHGIHFHATGRCEGSGASAFASAGAHFNPLGRQHGLDNAAGPHAGDAPNFSVGADGTVRVAFTTDRVSLTEGSTSLFDGDGSAVVIHASADDQISQPSGNSGARIACGVLEKN